MPVRLDRRRTKITTRPYDPRAPVPDRYWNPAQQHRSFGGRPRRLLAAFNQEHMLSQTAQLTVLKNKLEASNKLNKDLKDDLHRLNFIIGFERREKQELEAKILDKDQTILSQNDEITQMRRAMDDLESAAQVHRFEKLEMRGLLEAKQRKVRQLRDDHKELDEMNQEMHEQNQQLHEDNQEQWQWLCSANNDLANSLNVNQELRAKIAGQKRKFNTINRAQNVKATRTGRRF
jgi:hypothetical protein